jgi:DNA repair exonuclease SbcCD ATPase subunit
MQLHRITITNFRSFKGEQTFRFPEEPGLYFMQGVNALEPRLEANGSGKSTIWEALLWCLYGKTSRGLKAGDVCNWDADKGTKVEFAYQMQDNISIKVMTRTWKPNSWTVTDLFGKTIDLTKDEQSLSDIRLEFMPFLHCILMAQSQPMFLDLKHDAQASLFSEVLGLDHWIDYSSAASKRATAQDMESRQLERRLSEVTGRIDAQQDFKGSIEGFETDREFELSGFVKPYHDGCAQLRVLKNVEQDAIALETKRRTDYKVARDLLDLFQNDTFKPAQKAYDELRTQLRVAIARADDLDAAWLRVKEQKDCPTCKRPLDRTEHAEHMRLHEKAWRAANAIELGLEDQVSKAEAALDGMSRAGVKLLDAFNKATDALGLAEQSVKTQRMAILRVGKELDDLESQVEAIEKRVNPFLEVQAKAKEEGKRLRAERVEIQEALDQSSGKHRLYSYWVRGFKELRLQLIAEALTELEIEVNSCVTALGLVDWELKFEVDRETKGGSIARGFSVQVISPNGSKPTPWEAWSGGESQRLRLAATMGLSNLIRSRMGVELDLEVWDEPSTALSPQGVRDLLEALEHRAHQEQRIIFVVDHTAHAFGGFAGGATITKTRKGSSIEQY